MTRLRVERNASACALPRPSATASAALANRTVNHNQADTDQMNPAGASPWPSRACVPSKLVTMLPRYTTHITGFLNCARGESFLKASLHTVPHGMARNDDE